MEKNAATIRAGNVSQKMDRRDQAQEHLIAAASIYREIGIPFWSQEAELEIDSLNWTVPPTRPNARKCAGFRTPAVASPSRARAAGVGKAPRHEIAGEWAPSAPRALWGFGRGVRLDEVGSRCRPVALRRGMGVGDGLTSTAGAAGQGWRCDSGRFIDLQ